MTGSSGQELPARTVRYPDSVSECARGMLATMASFPASNSPDPADVEGWRARARQSDATIIAMMKDRIERAQAVVDSSALSLGGVPCFRVVAKTPGAGRRVMLDIHGGGFTSGAGKVCEAYGVMAAAAYDACVYAVDYRMPPDHRYPAALDDCVAAYRALLGLHEARSIVIRGVSAGGNLAAALMLRARGEGLPLPAGILLVTPELDLTESGDSFQTNTHLDVVLKGSLMAANLLYAGGSDLSDPHLSPLFGDFAPGFPPALLTAGTRDLFLSNAARMHNALRRSGSYSELIVEEAMPHGGFFGAPEDEAFLADTVNFADRAWAGSLPRVRG